MEKNKIHICFLAEMADIHTFKFVDYFLKRGYKVSIISFTPGEVEGVLTYFIDLGYFSRLKLKYILGLPKVMAILSKIRPDIVHAIYLTSFGFVGAFTKQCPLVVSAVGSDVVLRAKKTSLFSYFTRYAISRAELIHSQSPHLTARLIELGVEKDRIITFTYGIDLENYKQKSKDCFNKINKIVISTRRLNPIYNIKLLLNAIPFILEKVPDAMFLLIGDGEQEKELKSLAEKLKINDVVRFTGKLPNVKVIDLLSQADVYVSTSFSDGQSISLLEAMAAGTFPVVTDIDANREWIEDGENGFLCSVFDSKDLARKIVRALSDDKLRFEASRRNKDLLEEKGSYRKNMGLLEKYYTKLIQNK
jgi:glycosyltransferase involved in cell wall biosynthesis